jgi:hypothetical protein
VNEPVPRLPGKQSRTSKIAVKSSSHSKISVSSGEQHQTLRNVRSFGSSMPSWNAYVDKHLENCESNTARFGGTRDERIEDCEFLATKLSVCC